MLRFSGPGCFLAALIVIAATTRSEAKVLRNKHNAPPVSVFKDAGALSQYNKLAHAASRDNRVSLLLICKAPQGRKIEALSSGYRTAFIRVVEGSAIGCRERFRLKTSRIRNAARREHCSLIWVKGQRGKLLDAPKEADCYSRRYRRKQVTAPQSVEDTPCFVTFSLLLRRSFFSLLHSSQVMHMRVAAAAAGFEEAEVFMGAVCAPEDFTVEATAAVPLMPDAFMAVAATAQPEGPDQVTQ